MNYEPDKTQLQVPQEIEALAEIVRRENVGSLLEIGSKFGGSLWPLANAMPKGSRVVSVDLPEGTKAWPQSEAMLTECINRLREGGYDAQLIWGDSTADEVIERVRGLAPFDLVFIDGNHTLPYLEKDWENYGPLARIVAFHDIAWFRNSTWVGTKIDVPLFWNQVKFRAARHEEFRFCPTLKNNGIGVLWR